MNTRQSRFFACVRELEAAIPSQSDQPTPAIIPWSFASLTHPIGGEKMAWGQGAEYTPHRGGEVQVRPVVTAVRRADGVVESGVGLDFTHRFLQDTRLHLLPHGEDRVGFVHCPETSPANKGSAQVRVKWSTKGAAPGVEKFRGWPGLGELNEHFLHLSTEMPTGWASGQSERNETAITQRVTEYDATDEVVLGIPWVHRWGELIVKIDLEPMRKAAQHVRSLVAPPPSG